MSALSELGNAISACQKCQLAEGRTKVVPGEGSENAEILFIGEAPGFNEDQQGRPFVGAAGQFLETLLAAINLTRKDVFIANVIKCRPPENREPMPGEIRACRPWLDMQIGILKPKIIVTLGSYAMSAFFPDKSISKAHAIPIKKDGVLYFPMYHPAAALHQGNLRQVLLQDIQKIPALLSETINKGDQQKPKQLNMFG